MLIARAKKKTNIAEYILYMWQIEDMLRALNLNIELVDRNIVPGFQVDEHTTCEIHDWYDNLINKKGINLYAIFMYFTYGKNYV